MTMAAIKEWEREFRKAAEADNLAMLRDHLKKHDLPDKPKQLLEGTILVVRACCAYAHIDGRLAEEFLALQKYDPRNIRDAKYVLIFELCGKAFARILVSSLMDKCLDLADLYGHPWYKYKTCGFSRIWISRHDGIALTSREKNKIEECITYDLRFDDDEEELGFWFDDSTLRGVLRVEVYDVMVDVEEEDEKEGVERRKGRPTGARLSH